LAAAAAQGYLSFFSGWWRLFSFIRFGFFRLKERLCACLLFSAGLTAPLRISRRPAFHFPAVPVVSSCAPFCHQVPLQATVVFPEGEQRLS
jgi:hypothetical protein